MFARKCSIIGAVHVLPLPGSAGYQGSMEQILGAALEDAQTYKENGIDALILENMHDIPYLKGYVDPETTAAMTVIANAVKYDCMMPIGVQMLAGANIEALGIAVACDLDFIRAEGFVYAHVGDEGLHESCAAALIRKRSFIKGDRVKIFADIKKKHSAHAITDDVTLVETAKAACMFGADGVVVTGIATAEPTELADVKAVRLAVQNHVLVGSGVNIDNVHDYMPHADALIVGSSLKLDGKWQNQVDGERVKRFMDHVRKLKI